MDVCYGLHLKTSRKNAKLTQERAAEMLHVSVDSIRDYERGIRNPSEDFVLKAKSVYKDQSLGTKYLLMVSLVGREELSNICRQASIVIPQFLDLINSMVALAG